ncbi:short-chain dehydrogenase reductase [Colletotrichum truncatum]|uniref:Short-chain dehydrogenase reductase n=1 Tax=Colletotrichum truncatum TaxID=5467 RepID=A0ACC3Z0F1_COLTU
MSRPWIFVSPSSRGIGRHLTRYLLRTTTAPILATSRADNTAAKQHILDSLPEAEDLAPRLKVVRVDVTDESTVEAAAEEARALFPTDSHHLRLALAIPGILHPEKSLAQVEYDKALETFKVNTLGQMLLMKHFCDFLPRKSVPLQNEQGLARHAVWAAMSARVGSTSDNRKGGWYSYRASKAGVTSLAKSLDLWLGARSGDKAMAVAYHPGTVKTGLSEAFWSTVPKGQLFEPEYAVERMCSVLTKEVGLDGRGRCWDWQGKEILP